MSPSVHITLHVLYIVCPIMMPHAESCHIVLHYNHIMLTLIVLPCVFLYWVEIHCVLMCANKNKNYSNHLKFKHEKFCQKICISTLVLMEFPRLLPVPSSGHCKNYGFKNFNLGLFFINQAFLLAKAGKIMVAKNINEEI